MKVDLIVLIVIACASQLVKANFLNSISRYSFCKVAECCQVDPDLWILNKVPGRNRIPQLKYLLTHYITFTDFSNFFGQHVAKLELQRSLGYFYKRQDRSKPLVLSFHGTPGTGKNYAALQIVEARYKKAAESNFVHGYSGRVNFPSDDPSDLNKYRESLRNDIVANVKSCPHQTFIFDEVDKMPAGVFESIVALLDHNPFMKDIDLSKSLFIFISNLAGIEIGNRLSLLMRKEGLRREDTQYRHFEREIEICAYNYEGGFKNSRSIEKAVIDLFIPFMPLERRHVEQCIERIIELRPSLPKPDIVK